MKKTITFFLLIPAICSGQIHFNFENHGISQWTTSRESSWDTSSIKPVSGRYSLRHIYDNPDAGHDQASFCIDSLHPERGTTEWYFRIRHGYEPSSSNNWSVFLMADAQATHMFPGENVSGFAVGVNLNGYDDLLKIWKVIHGSVIPIITTDLNWQEKIGINSAGLKVTRSAEGNWEVLVSFQDSIFVSEGKCQDLDLMSIRDFGIYYKYSSKQDCKLWMDDIHINGIFIRDTLPPGLIRFDVMDTKSLVLTFTESLDLFTATTVENYFVDQGIGYPGEIIMEGADKLRLVFNKDFPDGITCILRIEGVSDMKGNMIGLSEYTFTFHTDRWFDIIINEIMADPSPTIGLPEFEYLELYNRSNHKINLTGWNIKYGNTLKVFPDIEMDMGSFLILIYEDAFAEFNHMGNCLPIFTSRTSLANSGSNIEIRNAEGRLISWTQYSDEWFENDYYRVGGWSLERVDPERFCSGIENWKVSTDPAGGTPGRINTADGMNPDTIRPVVSFIEIPEESSVEVFFNESMDSTTLLLSENYFIAPGIGNPAEIRLKGPDYLSAILILGQPLKSGFIYNLQITGQLFDCNGNILDKSDSIRFAKPEMAEKEDVLISEIMFNPLTGKSEFIEIFNHSTRTIDLSQLLIAERNEKSGGMASFTAVCQTHKLFFPEEFIVLTKNNLNFQAEYPNARGNILGIPDMFSLNDEQGTILILDKWLQIIDELSYNDEMHFPLLASPDGVSLERTSYERPSNDAGNWHSAAENAGFSTPGYENSQRINLTIPEMDIGVEPEIFTPDNDGEDDFTNICYSFGQPGNVLNIWIFDPMGRIVRQLANNLLAGTSGCITWDGTNDHGQSACMGIYLIYVRLFDLEGRTRQIKKTCVLSVRK